MPYAILLAFAFVSALLAGQTAQLNTTFDRLNETGTVSVETENQTTLEPTESNIMPAEETATGTTVSEPSGIIQPTEENISGIQPDTPAPIQEPAAAPPPTTTTVPSPSVPHP